MRKYIFIIIALISYTLNSQVDLKTSATIIYGISITKEDTRFRVNGIPNMAYSITLKEDNIINRSVHYLNDRGLGFVKYNRDKKTELIVNLN
jgi:hypothetical protein